MCIYKKIKEKCLKKKSKKDSVKVKLKAIPLQPGQALRLPGG
jgi:hypothetical protein